MAGTRAGWECELGRWLKPFLERLGHKARQRMCPLYVAGLIGPGDRKSVQPMAERFAPGDYDQLHHLCCCWCLERGSVGNRTPRPSRQARRRQRCDIGDRRHCNTEERQALGRCRCAICFGIGQDRQLPDAGITDAGAWRGAGDGGSAPLPSRKLDERSGPFEAGWRSSRTLG